MTITRIRNGVLTGVTLGLLSACGGPQQEAKVEQAALDKPVAEVQHHSEPQPLGKPVVYQVFTRLFGNTKQENVPWGTLEQNGVGKFNDFTHEALEGIKQLGVSHIWYTGILHHALVGDYRQYGISQDDPDVIKGRAGSPYAIKDYYDVNPDLAVDPAQGLQEFKALIGRTHQHGMQVIIDIVPNHVARGYESLGKPEGVQDFGANDDSSLAYKRDNNFYYVPGQAFKVPKSGDSYKVLGGDTHSAADGEFKEIPAKWTGNGSRAAQPKLDDWYETVKLNYGVKPDGSYDFASLDPSFRDKDLQAHAEFWAKQDVPDTWKKFRDIVHFWLDLGVDGFRYDVAELVPVEFWSYLNSSIKMKNPDAFLLAEVYNPKLYRDYIYLGKMDYLYDKVGLYDDLKPVMQGKQGTDHLVEGYEKQADIEQYMLHFLENHDEQRIASPEFAGDAQKGKPAMVVSALNNSGPTMLYFGQVVGEDGSEDMGFGDPSRTSIFDYAGVPAHQRWMNQGKFDGAHLSKQEKALREYYAKLMNIVASHPVVKGEYHDLHKFNRSKQAGYHDKMFAFARHSDGRSLFVLSHFDAENNATLEFNLPQALVDKWQMGYGKYQLQELLTGDTYELLVNDKGARIGVSLRPLESLILELNLM